jgi:hypothetical protein
MNEDIDKLNIKILREDVNIDKDSIKIYLSKYVNEKKVDERVLCQSSYKIESDYESFLFSLFKRAGTKDNIIFEDGYPFQFNCDSSFVLFTETDFLDNINSPSKLYLINLSNCSTTLIQEFELNSNYISKLDPVGSSTVILYSVGSPAKWIDNDKFVLGTNNGIYYYDLKDSSNSCKKLNVPINSNFQLVGDKLVNQTSTSIYILDYNKRKKTDLFVEPGTIGLRKTENFLFFLKGWSLYRCDLEKLEKPIKIYKAGNLIKNYWIIDDDQFIIRSGDLTSVPNFDDYYYYNNKTGEKIFIDNVLKVYDDFISSDKKYFIINKKVIQLKHYEVLSVYDIENRVKYDFDMQTIQEQY